MGESGTSNGPAAQAVDWLDRLDRVETRRIDHARAGTVSGLTGPDAATGERWDAGQVWAHLAEFGPYWLAELQLVLDASGVGPVSFGRVKTNPVRIAAIESGRHEHVLDQLAIVRGAIEKLRVVLEGMSDLDWARVGRHETLGILDVPAQLQHFHVGHYEEHADQLDELGVA